MPAPDIGLDMLGLHHTDFIHRFYATENDEVEDSLTEIRVLGRALVRLMLRHRADYEEIVREIDERSLHEQIEGLKAQLHRQRRQIESLQQKNPHNTNVLALEETLRRHQEIIHTLRGEEAYVGDGADES